MCPACLASDFVGGGGGGVEWRRDGAGSQNAARKERRKRRMRAGMSHMRERVCRSRRKGECSNERKDAAKNPKVVSQEEWLAGRKELLVKEKQLTRQSDALAAERQNLPWVKVEKQYVFDTPKGKKKLGICSTAAAS